MRAVGSLLVVAAVLAGAPSGGSLAQTNAVTPAILKVKVLRTYPHDSQAFTQGLIWRDGILYESTGLVGRSSLRKVDLVSGAVKQQVPVNAPYFAEGLADVGNRLFQLTWQHGRVFVYDKNTFNRVGEMATQGEGWGLCHDGRSLIMSNGGDSLTVRDPDIRGHSDRSAYRERPRAAAAERARVCRHRCLRECLDDRHDRPHRHADRPRDREDRRGHSLAARRRLGADVLNGYRLRPGRPHVPDYRQALAEAVSCRLLEGSEVIAAGTNHTNVPTTIAGEADFLAPT